MVKGFWKKLKKPISILAPMYGVTDVAFRELITTTARPDVFFTEFVNCDHLISEKGRNSALDVLKFTKNQRPIVAQLWGINPETHFQVAQIIKKLGFDGIDINMGCPQKAEMKTGACATLIDNTSLAKELILATIKGAGDLPVSIKTRTGVKEHKTERWIEFLLNFDISTISLHGRTAKQMSKIPADWNEIAKAANDKVLVIGNGDVENNIHGEKLCKEYGTDGFMIGRGIFKDLYCFDTNAEKISKVELLKKHIKLAKKYDIYFPKLKKFIKIYISDFSGAGEMRQKFMSCSSYEELETYLG